MPLGQQQHDGAKQRVLRGRIAHIGQTGQVGNEGRRGDARGQVVGRDDEDQALHVVPAAGEPDEEQVGGGAEAAPSISTRITPRRSASTPPMKAPASVITTP
jgi:hypothetical protein